jgi:hypothetical protein
MSAHVKPIGFAPPNSRCDCEHAGCTRHKAGACHVEGVFYVESFGIRHILCAACLRRAQVLDKAKS